MDRRTFEGLSAFAKIAELGSFARAAGALNLTPSALSQLINQTEDALGVRLLNRTTRSVAPSAVGERLLARLQPVFDELAAAVGEAQDRPEHPSGPLRITTSRIAAELVITPRLAAFTDKFPDVALEISIDDSLVDIVANRFDAGVRLGERVERDMVAVEIGGRQRLVVVATPGYWAKHGKPRQPKDLLAHRCIGNLMPNRAVYRWELERDGQELELPITGPVITNDPHIVELAVVAGCGVGFLFEAQAQRHGNALESVLHAWCPSFPGFQLYCPTRRQLSPALRAFIDAMKKR
ncbi:MAG: LysR family transcriptional regulator [Kofleriaceae bacterium]